MPLSYDPLSRVQDLDRNLRMPQSFFATGFVIETDTSAMYSNNSSRPSRFVAEVSKYARAPIS